MSERQHISCTETAKLVRLVLKESFPGHKFSVTCDRSAGGENIDVRWRDGPSTTAVDAVRVFASSYFDGMTDYRGRRYHTMDGTPVRFGSDMVTTHRRVSKAIAESMVADILAKPGRGSDWLRISGNEEDGYRVLQSPGGPNMSLDIEEWEKFNTPQPKDSPTLARVKLTHDDRPTESVRTEDRLFSGVFPEGIVYADRQREVGGDYKRLAFLSFRTLELEVEKDCPDDLGARIKKAAADLQARKGQPFQVSTSGQHVTLGYGLPANESMQR